MKGLLLFLAGLLVGANVVYFLVTRECPAPRSDVARTDVPGADQTGTPAATTPAAARIPQSPFIPAPVPAGPSPATVPPTTPSAIAVMPPSATGMLLPVAGVKPSQLTDTFNQARGSERRHEALDIMAARGTPVVAAVDGKVEKLFTSKQGGLTIYEFDPTATHAYYYAHLDRYAAGLVEGMPLKRGDVIGYVGSTGNANPEAPHLHFAIFELGPEKHWWQGTAINPYPLLTAPH
jgi:murein DD-endopeptidase MepM/ murein hydrolase activator NlpD